MNEADPTSPTWQSDFYGDNYPTLLTVKRKWDPNGVFWCKTCVGSTEDWEIVDGPGDDNLQAEWGLGQFGGRVCRKSGSGVAAIGVIVSTVYVGVGILYDLYIHVWF